ncbi:UNVERIFIED_ORG: hypothetical protein FHU01_4533 [Citrobacter freundii]
MAHGMGSRSGAARTALAGLQTSTMPVPDIDERNYTVEYPDTIVVTARGKRVELLHYATDGGTTPWG